MSPPVTAPKFSPRACSQLMCLPFLTLWFPFRYSCFWFVVWVGSSFFPSLAIFSLSLFLVTVGTVFIRSLGLSSPAVTNTAGNSGVNQIFASFVFSFRRHFPLAYLPTPSTFSASFCPLLSVYWRSKVHFYQSFPSRTLGSRFGPRPPGPFSPFSLCGAPFLGARGQDSPQCQALGFGDRPAFCAWALCKKKKKTHNRRHPELHNAFHSLERPANPISHPDCAVTTRIAATRANLVSLVLRLPHIAH